MQTDPKPPQAHCPRPEALPYNWADLTEDQQSVAVAIHEYLIAFVSFPPEAKRSPGPFNWRLDRNRESNVILIDGERGSGKTSVLLTVIELWLRVLRHETTDRAPPQIVEKLQRGELAGKLIPLRVLDLQPLPRSTSLLTWLAGRLLEFVDDLEGVDARERGAPPAPIGSWNPKSEVELHSRKAWRELLQDAAAGWESNLSQRKKDLDPESYAVELGQAERARLSIHDRWRDFVDRVAEDAHQRLRDRGVKQDVRFVLSIDDADMNPHRCVELLDLLRTFWHPRLVFVLTGNTNLFIKTLQLHYLGRFREAVGPASLGEPENNAIASDPNALELARSAYDKAIPRWQRYTLRTLPPQERFKLLGKALAVELRRRSEDLPPANLAGYFELDPFLQHGLPGWLRGIQDLKQHLSQLSSPEFRKRASVFIQELWRDKVETEAFPGIEQELLDLVQLRNGGLFIKYGPGLPLRWRSNTPWKDTLPGSTVPLKFSAAEGFEYKLPRLLEKGQSLSKSVVAWLLLAMNVAGDEMDGQLAPGVMPQEFEYPLVSGVVLLGTGKEAEFVWPLPNWGTLLEVSLMALAWTQAGLGQILSTNDPGELARRYVLTILMAHARKRRTEPAPDDKDVWKTLASRITEALERVKADSTSKPVRQRAFDRWLCDHMSLLAAPESGLPAETANEILGTLLDSVPSGLQPELRDRLKRGRMARAKLSLTGFTNEDDNEILDILRQIDGSHPGFEWAARIENRTSISQDLVDKLNIALARFRVRHHPASLAKTPNTLSEYANEISLLELVRHYPRARLKKWVENMNQLALKEDPVSHAVLALWNALIEEAPQAERTSLRDRIAVTATGLRVTPPPKLDRLLREPETHRGNLLSHFEMSNGITWQFRVISGVAEVVADEFSGLLSLAHDIAVDEMDVDPTELPPSATPLPVSSMTWGAPFPGASSVYLYRDKEVLIDWLVPRWPTYLDWRLTMTLWDTSLLETQPLAAARVFLGGLGAIAHRNEVSVDSSNSWMNALDLIHRPLVDSDDSANTRFRGARWERFKEWAEIGAVLFAAPELGLPEEESDTVLRLLCSSIQPSRRTRIVAARRAWAQRALRLAGLEHDDEAVNRFLSEIDGLNPDHPWHKVIGTDVSLPRAPSSPA